MLSFTCQTSSLFTHCLVGFKNLLDIHSLPDHCCLCGDNQDNYPLSLNPWWILETNKTKTKKKPLQELRRAVATWKDTLTWPSQASYLLQMQKSFTHLKLMCLLTLYHSRPPDNIDFLPYQKLQIEIKVRTQLIDKAILENQVGY